MKPIEEFFLESLLKICFASILIITATDFYFSTKITMISWVVNSSVTFAIIVSALSYRYGYYKLAVVLISLIITSAMFYQSLVSQYISTTSMAVVLMVGFGYSVLLKGKLAVTLHAINVVGMAAVFTWLSMHPQRYGRPDGDGIIVGGVIYGLLYFIISYSTRVLKQRYDLIVKTLAETNNDLFDKANEIEAQNEELIQSQENLNQVNSHLEALVEERTLEVRKQNDQLIKYAYANAHHVRGPVARILGLIQLSKMETSPDLPFLFQKIEEQAVEMDLIVRSINRELQAK